MILHISSFKSWTELFISVLYLFSRESFNTSTRTTVSFFPYIFRPYAVNFVGVLIWSLISVTICSLIFFVFTLTNSWTAGMSPWFKSMCSCIDYVQGFFCFFLFLSTVRKVFILFLPTFQGFFCYELRIT